MVCACPSELGSGAFIVPSDHETPFMIIAYCAELPSEKTQKRPSIIKLKIVGNGRLQEAIGEGGYSG